MLANIFLLHATILCTGQLTFSYWLRVAARLRALMSTLPFASFSCLLETGCRCVAKALHELVGLFTPPLTADDRTGTINTHLLA